MEQEATDEDLMLQYQQGDAAAFEVLYTRHKGPVYRFILRMCKDTAITEELFQDVWVKIIQHRLDYAVSARFTTYLYTITRNHVIDHFRKTGKQSLQREFGDEDVLPARETDEPVRQVELQQLLARLIAGLDGLPAKQREVFLLREEAGMSLKEIATLTGENLDTVKSRLRYAVRKLRQVINYGQ